MKLIILFVLLMAAQANAGWFDKTEDRLRAEEHQLRTQVEQQLKLQRQNRKKLRHLALIAKRTFLFLTEHT